MADFIISTESTQDLNDEYCAKRDIHYVCFHFEIDGEQYMDNNGKSMPFKTFYDRMRAGSMTRTSQVNVDEYINYFEPFLKEGKDIVHLSLSSGISGTYNSAMIAKDQLEEKYPDRKIYALDSLAASCGLGFFVDRLCDLRDEGKSAKEIYDFAVENRLKVDHWFFTDDLTYLIRGGRVSKAAGVIGKMLNICPLLTVLPDGSLSVKEKIRGKKKTMERMVELMSQKAENGTDYSGKCFIGHADNEEGAEELAAMIREKFPNMSAPIEKNYIGTTIGAHTGPGLLLIGFWRAEKRTV